MTLSVERSRAQKSRDIGVWVVPLAVIVAVALRLPVLNHSPGPDEAGFLMVGGQWHSGGTSLYGNYWVDRPPLLVSIFQLASNLGGLTALRLIGCVAVACIVSGTAIAARVIAGARAGRWAAITAAALCTSPLLGTRAVNGELLAAPFIVLGMIASLYALKARQDRSTRILAMVAGASAMSALLVKQNLADAFIFGLVVTVVAWHRGDIDTRRLYRILASAIGGALLAIYVVAFVTTLHGTSLSGVFNAMYPFRLDASRVQATEGGQHSIARLSKLLVEVVSSGLGLLVLAVGWGVLSKRLRGAAAGAVLATIAFGVVSIGFGGNYWAHYLVELIVPLAIAIGILVGRSQPLAKPFVAAVAGLAVFSSLAWVSIEKPTSASRVGHAIAAASAPGDTIVTVYGHADIDQQAGLNSPYENLWSLPTKTLDPHLLSLNRVLAGPRAPTWFVTWGHLSSWGVSTEQVRSTLARDYRVFSKLHGRTIYLHDGLTRPPLTSPAKDGTP